MKLVCPKCLRTVETVIESARASCEHGKPSGRFNPPTIMIPVEQLTEKVEP